ncbi:MAG: DotU family type IV/VI secretion system protein [Planctomycetota bacterium]
MSGSDETPRLADHCSKLFLFLATFRRNAKTAEIDPEWLRRSMIEIVDELEAGAQRDAELKRLWEKGKYPVVALADEVALNTEWAGQDEWEEDLVEQHYFGTAIAGEEFFVRLKEVAPDEDQLAEVYFICLSLGFKGRYRSRPEEREEMRQRLYRTLPGRLTSKSEPICPGIEEATVEKEMVLVPAAATLRLVALLIGAMGLAVIAGRVIAHYRLAEISTLSESILAEEQK